MATSANLAPDELDWSRCAIRFSQQAGCKMGTLTGPNPTDRDKLGSKIHLLTDWNSLTRSLGICGANMHDSQGLEPLVRGIPAEPLMPWPTTPTTGEPKRRQGLRSPASTAPRGGIWHRMTREKIESSQQLGPADKLLSRVMASRLPSPPPPLRTQGRTLSRLRGITTASSATTDSSVWTGRISQRGA